MKHDARPLACVDPGFRRDDAGAVVIPAHAGIHEDFE